MASVDGVPSLAELRTLAAEGLEDPWDGSETELEGGLERWVEALAEADGRLGVRVAIACAEHALPLVRESAAASGLDFGGPDDEWGCSMAPSEQLGAVRRWLDEGDELPPPTVDYTRQLNVWEDDLRPPDESPGTWFTYFVEATNLLAMAVLHGPEPGPYGEWRGPRCAARSAVCAYKAMNRDDGDRIADLEALLAAVEDALGPPSS